MSVTLRPHFLMNGAMKEKKKPREQQLRKIVEKRSKKKNRSMKSFINNYTILLPHEQQKTQKR